MSKGIIYLMSTIVPGLIKIGKAGTNQYESRMYTLEHNGYCNVTGLKREFAIEVEDYDDKEKLLHTIFDKSRVAGTELFAIDLNIVTQLLASFEGRMVYPKEETKEVVFEEASENTKSKLIPDGYYTLSRRRRGETKTLVATSYVQDGCWTLKKGSMLVTTEREYIGLSNRAKLVRLSMPTDSNGVLLEDYELGECSPSFAGCVVRYAPSDGWLDWKNKDGKEIDIYRKQSDDSDD